MIFFFKSDGTLIKSAPDTVYQGSTEAGKIYVVMPFNANAAADVYFRLPNGENWGPYILTNHGVVTDSANLPTGWGLWSVDLESAITQYAGTLTAQFGFTQASGKIKEGETEKYPLLTTSAVTITIAKGVTRYLPKEPSYDVYEVIKKSVNAINEKLDGVSENWLTRTGDDKIALKNNESLDYSKAATAETIAQRTDGGQVKVADGVEDNDAVTVKQLNDSETETDNLIEETKTELQGKIDLKLDKSVADTRFVKKAQLAAPFLYAGGANGDTIGYLSTTPNANNIPQYSDSATLQTNAPVNAKDAANKQWVEAQIAAAHTSVYTYKGSKDTYANLPATGNKVGDVWNVEDTGINYAWNGADWDSLRASVLDSTGDSTVQAMSQKATTDELNKKTSQEVFVGESQPTGSDARIWVDTSTSTSILSKIYGVNKVGQESPTLTRTDDAVGLSYNVGSSVITSDFDNCYPWSEMKEVTDASGNVFIKIPKFYSKITANDDGTYKHQISGTQHEGFTTLFVDGNGNELDYVLVGKYEGSGSASRIYSKSNATVLVNITCDNFRTGCKANGAGYQQYDFLIDLIIKELWLIEMKTTNSQSVMYGYANGNSAAVATGRTDAVKTPSGSEESNTDGKHACKYRGIENPWGNIWTWCDGVNFKGKKIYICESSEDYASDKYDAPYSYMGDRKEGDGYTKVITPFEKNPLLGFTTEVGAGSTTHYSDYYYYNANGTVLLCGGAWGDGVTAGLWRWTGSASSSSTSGVFGGRLCYKPIRN